MAGDWIKMRSDLATDPAVIRVAAATGLDTFGVVGRLHALWVWADTHTADGSAPGISVPWVSQFVSHAGFAEALVSVGWLEVCGDGFRIPNFARHMGHAAKRRAAETDRKRTYRARGVSRSCPKVVPQSVPPVSQICPTKSGTREEKRREEKKEESPPSPPLGGGVAVGPKPEEVREEWNRHPGLTPCPAMGPHRERQVRAWAVGNPAWAEHWRAAIRFLGSTPDYVGGMSSGWRADLTWFLKVENFTRVVERMLAPPSPVATGPPPDRKAAERAAILDAAKRKAG